MSENIDLTAQLARWSQFLVGLAQTGIGYANNPYDVERYEELLKLAAEISATINPDAKLDPTLAAQLEAMWHHQTESDFPGYITPNVSVGSVVFNDRDEILLVYSNLTNIWVYPVGGADVGYTAAEIAQKEVKEESGLDVTPLHLMAVHDSYCQGFNLNTHIYNLAFYCRLDGGKLQPQTPEIREARFFSRENLPASLTDPQVPIWLKHAFNWHHGVSREPYFDPLPIGRE